MKLQQQKSRGRKPTRPNTPAVLRERARQRELYYSRDPFTSWATLALGTIRNRAKRLGVDCTLSRADLKAMLDATDMVCPVRHR